MRLAAVLAVSLLVACGSSESATPAAPSNGTGGAVAGADGVHVAGATGTARSPAAAGGSTTAGQSGIGGAGAAGAPAGGSGGAGAGAAGTGGAGAGGALSACQPGETTVCVCDLTAGTAPCLPDGSGFGECDCGAAGAGGAGGAGAGGSGGAAPLLDGACPSDEKPTYSGGPSAMSCEVLGDIADPPWADVGTVYVCVSSSARGCDRRFAYGPDDPRSGCSLVGASCITPCQDYDAAHPGSHSAVACTDPRFPFCVAAPTVQWLENCGTTMDVPLDDGTPAGPATQQACCKPLP